MSFEELVRQMRLDLMMKWGEDYEFQAACVQKINGVEQPVLRIRRKFRGDPDRDRGCV